MPTITIVSIRKVDLENILAFLTIELDFGEGCRLTLYGIKLVKSKRDKSNFLGYPQRQAKDDESKWYNHYYPSPALADALLAQAQTAYKKK